MTLITKNTTNQEVNILIYVDYHHILDEIYYNHDIDENDILLCIKIYKYK